MLQKTAPFFLDYKMRLYLSGWAASTGPNELRVVQAGNIKHRCFSFVYIEKINGLPFFTKGLKAAHQVCIDNKVGIMMDSGVFTYRKYQAGMLKMKTTDHKVPLIGETEFIGLYAEFCKKGQKNWDFFMSCDLSFTAKDNLERYKQLQNLGVDSAPVFHGDDSIDYLRKYADLGCKLIGIGSPKFLRTGQRNHKGYLDAVFNLGAKLNLQFHGLALTSVWVMVGYPWFSVDASSWSQFACRGSICRFDEVTHRLTPMHVSSRHSRCAKGSEIKMNATTFQRIKEEVEAEGYDFEELRIDHVLRHAYNAKTMMKLAEYASKVQRTGWDLLF